MSQHTRDVLLYVPSMAVVPSSSSSSTKLKTNMESTTMMKGGGTISTVVGVNHDHPKVVTTSSSSSLDERLMSVDWSPLLITKEEFDDNMNHAGLTVAYSSASSVPASKG